MIRPMCLLAALAAALAIMLADFGVFSGLSESGGAEKRRRVYANVYGHDARGRLNGEIVRLKVNLYRDVKVKGSFVHIAEVEDNTELVVLDSFKRGFTIFLKVRTPGGKEGWVPEGCTRGEKYEYVPCKICDRRGRIKCPACDKGKIRKDGAEHTCRVCGGKGWITCRHCRGLGKIRTDK